MSSARVTSRHARCSVLAQSTSAGAAGLLANVTGLLEGRMRRRAHTAGLVVQRSAPLAASVTGGAAGRAPIAARRAQTTGFVAQRGVAAATLVASGRAGGVVRAARCAFNRAHTAGLLLQRSPASLTPGATQIRAPSSAGNTQRACALPRAMPDSADIVGHRFPSSSLSFTIVPITSLSNHASRGRDPKGGLDRATEV
jgi:hypothetical protein